MSQKISVQNIEPTKATFTAKGAKSAKKS